MASIFKRGEDKDKRLARWWITYTDENGKRRTVKGCPDRLATEAMARKLESEADLRRRGVIDKRADALAGHSARPLADHLDDWEADLIARGTTAKHARMATDRARRLVAVARGERLADLDGKTMTRTELAAARERVARAVKAARLDDLSADRIQSALASIRQEGRSLQTCNHYRASIRAFSRFAWKGGRLASDPLVGVSGFNAKEDLRHDRRTIGADELARLIQAAHDGPSYRGMSGPARALVYRLAVASGLRYSELATLTRESFSARPPAVTVLAAYAKNGQTATLPLPADLAADLAHLLSALAPGAPAFPLPEKGVAMLRVGLRAAGIPYRDDAGRVFDFHSLRCMLATLADQAGVSPRVVQRLMRHSTLELTGRYTRPRAVDIEGAVGHLPSFRPDTRAPESARATGTDGPTLPDRAAPAQRAGYGMGRDEAGTGEGGTPCKGPPETTQAPLEAGLVASCRKLSEVHPTGFEPVTFGSVDHCSKGATSFQ